MSKTMLLEFVIQFLYQNYVYIDVMGLQLLPEDVENMFSFANYTNCHNENQHKPGGQ